MAKKKQSLLHLAMLLGIMSTLSDNYTCDLLKSNSKNKTNKGVKENEEEN